MSIIKIGRSPTNQIILNHPQVSGTHAQITIISPNTLLIEDLGSANGTFINDLRIKRCIISNNDIVKIANVKIDLTPYFANNNKPAAPAEKKDNANDYTIEFAKLADIYEHYEQTKQQIKKGVTFKQTAVRAGFSLLPFVGNAIAIAVCATINEDEKLNALEKEFKINYVCPKCKTFLGYLPFEAVAAKKSCMSCKAIWVK